MRRTKARLAVVGALGTVVNVGCAAQFHLKRADHYFTTPEVVAAANAIQKGDARGLERKIARGLDVNARGREGMDLLKWSLGRFCLECFEKLLEHGADIERPPAGEYTARIDPQFLMPIMELAAAYMDDPAYLASLLRHGGNPNALEVYGSRPIIFEAIMGRRMESVRLLVEAGADIDARSGLSLETPVLRAVAVNEYEIAYYLLERGADPMLETNSGFSVVDRIKSYKNRGVSEDMHGWYVKVVERLGLDPDEVTLNC